MGYLGATLRQVFTRVRGRSGRVTQRCHNSPRWETGIHSANDVTHRKRAEDFGRFWKSQLVELRTASEEKDSHEMGSRWKSQNRKIVPLSPDVEKPFNSKVIKSFLPELRSRKCFSCSEIPMFYVIYIYIYIYICTSHIHFAYSCIWQWYTPTIASSINAKAPVHFFYNYVHPLLQNIFGHNQSKGHYLETISSKMWVEGSQLWLPARLDGPVAIFWV